MAWLVSLLAPWLWPILAVAAAGLWIWATILARTTTAGALAAEIVRLGTVACACGAVALAIWSTADAACRAEIEAATRAEVARQREIVDEAVTQARAEGAAAMADAAAARVTLDAALAAADRVPPDPAEPACGLSKRWLEALPE